jgi:hypothetical protein
MPAHPGYDLAVAHFFSDFDPKSKPRPIREIMENVIQSQFSPVITLDVVDQYCFALQELLVFEFNDRFVNGKTLRYSIADAAGEGSIIGGALRNNAKGRIAFQDLLNSLTPTEFEGLAAHVLGELGCDPAFRTTLSNDQGIDGFGYRSYLPGSRTSPGYSMTFLAQAKHYRKSQVGTKEVREFVGAVHLALHHIYSSVDDLYQLLDLKPFEPTALVLITSEEVISSVRRLADRAGLVVYSSDDLYEIFWPDLKLLRPPERLAYLKVLSDSLPVAY